MVVYALYIFQIYLLEINYFFNISKISIIKASARHNKHSFGLYGVLIIKHIKLKLFMYQTSAEMQQTRTI